VHLNCVISKYSLVPWGLALVGVRDWIGRYAGRCELSFADARTDMAKNVKPSPSGSIITLLVICLWTFAQLVGGMLERIFQPCFSSKSRFNAFALNFFQVCWSHATWYSLIAWNQVRRFCAYGKSEATQSRREARLHVFLNLRSSCDLYVLSFPR